MFEDPQIFSQAPEIDGQVYECEAECIHVNVQNLNIRFQKDDFLLFGYMISEALEKLSGVDIDEIYRILNKLKSKPSHKKPDLDTPSEK